MEASYSEDSLEGSRHKQENLGSCGQRVMSFFMKLFGSLLTLCRSIFSIRALVEKAFCHFLEVLGMPVYLLDVMIFLAMAVVKT